MLREVDARGKRKGLFSLKKRNHSWLEMTTKGDSLQGCKSVSLPQGLSWFQDFFYNFLFHFFPSFFFLKWEPETVLQSLNEQEISQKNKPHRLWDYFKQLTISHYSLIQLQKSRCFDTQWQTSSLKGQKEVVLFFRKISTFLNNTYPKDHIYTTISTSKSFLSPL